MIPTTIRLIEMPEITGFVPLGVLGYCLMRTEFLEPVFHQIALPIKTVEHAPKAKLLDVLVSGIGWEMVPACFPCGKTIANRLKTWLELDCFRTAWAALAEQYERLRGINWDKVLLDGSKHKAPKGGRVRDRLRWIALSAARPCTWRPMSTACPSGPP